MLKRITIFIFALLICALGFFLFRRWRTTPPPPTVVGWRAVVSTLAGDGAPHLQDAAFAQAGFAEPFTPPLGVAVTRHGRIYVANTYNDRIRLITPAGQVTTLAGTGQPGYTDGAGASALFDTPCALAVTAKNELIIADTGNDRL